MTTHITRVGTVIVPVSDQDRALSFYAGKLGMEVVIDGEYAPGRRWLEVAPAGATTTLALIPPDEGEPSTGSEVSLATADAEAAYSALSAAGVDADPIMRMGEYVPPMFRFRDPDGNRFRLVERE